MHYDVTNKAKQIEFKLKVCKTDKQIFQTCGFGKKYRIFLGRT